MCFSRSPSCIVVLCGSGRQSGLFCHSKSHILCRLVSVRSPLNSLPVADHRRVNVSDWRGVISMDSTGKSRFPIEVRGAERPFKHHAYPLGPWAEIFRL